ncbi:MAG: hypothetical protein ACI9S8_002738 [Chlamydiales bacterium]|jgi:hypothetical protein
MALHSFLKTDPRPVRPEVQFKEDKNKYIPLIKSSSQLEAVKHQLYQDKAGIIDESSVRGIASSLLYDLGKSLHLPQDKLAKFTHDAIRTGYYPCNSIRVEAEENPSLEHELEVHLVRQIAQSICSDKSDVEPFTEFYQKIYPNNE